MLGEPEPAVPWTAASFREVTEDLAPDVLAAWPPPVPCLGAPWSLRVVEPESDATLIAEWMARPHVAEFWDQSWPVERWQAVLCHQLAGRFIRPMLVCHHGTPLAYLEVYRTVRDVVGRHYPATVHDLGVHIAIGDPAGTRRGMGRLLMRCLADALFAADPRCERILADPDAAHLGARRMFAAAGFELLGEVELGHKRAALLCRPRSGFPSAPIDGEPA